MFAESHILLLNFTLWSEPLCVQCSVLENTLQSFLSVTGNNNTQEGTSHSPCYSGACFFLCRPLCHLTRHSHTAYSTQSTFSFFLNLCVCYRHACNCVYREARKGHYVSSTTLFRQGLLLNLEVTVLGGN